MGTSLSAPMMGQLEAFWNAMEQNGRGNQAEDISQLLACVQSIQMDLAEALDEVGYLKEQIQSLENATMKARLGRMQEEMQNGLCQAGKQVRAVEAEVVGGIQNAIETLKEKGVQVLDRILDTAHVSQILGRAENFLMQAAAGMEQKMGAVDCMAEEFHAMKGHAKNIGRAAVGRTVEEIGARDKTRGILTKIRAGMEYCKKVFAGLGQKALMARAHVVHLHQITEQKTEKVAGVQEIAKELRDASAMGFGTYPQSVQAR